MSRILVVIKGLGRGGAEQLLVNAAAVRDPMLHDYMVAYVLPHKSALVGELEALGIPVVCLGASSRAWPLELRHLVRGQGIDLVHVHSPVPAVAGRVTLPRRLPIVYTEHNVWTRYSRLTRWANAATYGRNTHVFAVSDEVRRSIRPLRFAQPASPPETLYHGPSSGLGALSVAPDGVRAEFGIPHDAPLVGTIANLKSHKGYPHLLDAAVLVRAEIPNVHFLIVGTGPLEDDLRRRIRELDLVDTVTMTGFREDATRLAASFDVFAMASLQEGLSIALLEAMALGRPPIVTRVGGLPEVVRDEQDGLLVPPGDPVALGSAIVRVLDDSQLRARLAAAARDRSTAFDIRLAVRRMEAVYAELLS